MKKGICLGERDILILKFLWKWKMATSALLMERFFPKISKHTAYKRLFRLESYQFIQARTDYSGRNFLWMLTKKGFEAIVSGLPELKEWGFQSENVLHDYLVSTIHLGDWATSNPEKITLISENQLRRLDDSALYGLVPSPKRHRSDGFWVGQKGEDENKSVALEVELSLKKSTSYMSPIHYYSEHKDKVVGVIWITKSLKRAQRLSKMLNENGADEFKDHHFVGTLGEVLKLGWEAKVKSINSKLEYTIEQTLGNTLGYTHPTSSELRPFSLMLNLRKTPHKAKGYDEMNQTQKSLLTPIGLQF